MSAPTESSSPTPAAASDVPELAEVGSDLTFIETQFPVSKMSKESYAERRANQSQTITGLGKWWGRKPLVLCRSAILGLLLPATDDPRKDRETFLRLMTMDDDGMLKRIKSIPQKVLYAHLPPGDRAKYFTPDSTEKKARFQKGLKREVKDELQRRVFLSMSYDDRLDYCLRPEQIDGPTGASWKAVNAHLGTDVHSIPELIAELGKRRFGHIPRVGDSFCGGGSIPFEAARIGCVAYGSDLNPVGTLQTWAAINIIGGGEKLATQIRKVQRAVFDAVDEQITQWGIEHRDPDPDTGRRWRADAFLYCSECVCPECGWRVPLAPTWAIAPTSRAVVRLVPVPERKSFDFEVLNDVPPEDLAAAADAGTTGDSELRCPHCNEKTPLHAIRGDGRGTFGDSRSLLRPWTQTDIAPAHDDIFGERLYCIRWVDTWTEWETNSRGEQVEKTFSERLFRAPTSTDLERERFVQELLSQRSSEWQARGFIPSRTIEPGSETTRLGRERGWTHWHHLFNPRQLLINGLFAERSFALSQNPDLQVATLLGVGRCADWNSRLCRWGTGAARESIAQTFSNQALNTLVSYASKGHALLDGSWFPISPVCEMAGTAEVTAIDAREVNWDADIWITDPPYADAVNYHELSEFFLAWYDLTIRRLFPAWSADSKRALAVSGSDESFTSAMIQCYSRLAERMPPDGVQIVMFTHQDASVWANLALILWAAGLRVTAAWCVQTEREASGTREGNYVQGTVLLVLRRQTTTETTFLDEVYQDVEAEVRSQLDVMRDLDDARDPSFGDTDYQLAAYAAALRVLTSRRIEEIDVAYELRRARSSDEKSAVEELIENAVRIACDHLVPRGVDSHFWKLMTPAERFYLKGIEIESHGEYRSGVYQELARGFRLNEYTLLLASIKANKTRLKTAAEFGRRELGFDGFGSTLVRHALFAIYRTTQTEGTREGLQWLHDEVSEYWASRERLIAILEYLATLGKNASMEHWHVDAHAADLMAGAVSNDHV